MSAKVPPYERFICEITKRRCILIDVMIQPSCSMSVRFDVCTLNCHMTYVVYIPVDVDVVVDVVVVAAAISGDPVSSVIVSSL